MHRRVLILLALLALGAWAPPARADVDAAVRVVDCAPWEQRGGGAVAYEARMRAIKGTRQMALRIRLLERFDDGEFHRVDAPGLGRWLKSRPGAGVFVHEQRIEGLRRGAVYRAVVDYRWLNADGERIASAERRSAPCRQGGALPNLRVQSIDVRRGEVEGTAVYRVTIVNAGESTARRVGVLLRVDGEVVDEVEVIQALQPGEEQTVRFSGPVCRDKMRVVVDPKQLIAESREEDNARAPTCL